MFRPELDPDLLKKWIRIRKSAGNTKTPLFKDMQIVNRFNIRPKDFSSLRISLWVAMKGTTNHVTSKIYKELQK